MIDRIILDIQLIHAEHGGQPVGFDQRSTAAVEADCRWPAERQQFLVTPQRGRPCGNSLTRQAATDEGIVILDFERPKTQVAHMDGGDRVFLAALTTA